MSIELREITAEGIEEESSLANRGTASESLAAVDGIEAWKYLIAATSIEAVLWAFPLAFGVFQRYYSELPEFQGDANIPVIGTIPTSMFYLGSLFITPLIQKYPRAQTPLIVIGWATCIVSLLAASFARTVSALIVTQGFLYGAGFLLVYPPILSRMNEWFAKHRGLAYGILYAGAGASGVGYPFIIQSLLSAYGYRTALRALAVGQALLVGPLLPLLKPRLPPAAAGSFRKIDLSFFRKPLFYCYAAANLFQACAFFIPALYLPSFTSLLGYSSTVGAVLLALNNAAQVLGQVALGHVSDRTDNVLLLAFVSSFVSSVAAFTLWGFARSLAQLIVFALVWGLFAGAFVVLWTRFGMVLSEEPLTVFNIMLFEKGIGNIITGPVSVSLLAEPLMSEYGMGKYGSLILWSGSFMLLSSLGILGLPLEKRREML